MSVTNHGYLGYLVVMSKAFWERLPDDLKAAVQQAMKETTIKERQWAIELDRSQFAKIEEYARKSGKLRITVLDPGQIAAWKRVMETIYPQFDDPKLIGKELIEAAMKAQ